jgi:hypothetical protein
MTLPRSFPLVSLLVILALGVAPWARGADAPLLHCQPGPWGRIEYHTLYLAAPDTILNEFAMPNPETRWCFEGRSLDWVRLFLTSSGLDQAIGTRLLADTRSQPDEEGVITLFPTEADLLALSPTTRSLIYHELGEYDENPFFQDPICIPDSNLDAWLNGTDFPPNVTALIRQLAYKDGDALFFGDLCAVLKYTANDAQARQWVRELTRVRAVVAFLQVDGTDDLPALRRYWSADFHRTDALPMLEAAAALPGGDRLDLTHLLPPLPRRLAYGYVSPDIERTGQTPNCHWTSLNFFNYTQQNILLDLKLASSKVLESYDPVSPPYTFGDVLFFLNKDGNAYHSCVYLADNLVFTKNGENEMMPWIVTRIEDVKQLYGREPNYQIQAYRRRWPVGE